MKESEERGKETKREVERGDRKRKREFLDFNGERDRGERERER